MRIARPALIAALGLTLTATGSAQPWPSPRRPAALRGPAQECHLLGQPRHRAGQGAWHAPWQGRHLHDHRHREERVRSRTQPPGRPGHPPQASEFRIWFRSAEQRDVTCTAQSPDGEVTGGAHIRFIQKESADFTVTCRMNTERVQAVHYLTLAAHSEHSTVGESTGWSLRTATTNDAVLTFLGKRSIPGGKLAKTGS